jgi:bleomycin hydrolase
MKKYFLYIVLFVLFVSNFTLSQELSTVKMLPYTEVKNQGNSGTCWCFSIMSIVESEMMKRGIEHPDLSELFVVRNIYLEKAKNYLLRQGFTRFDEGAFGHDVMPCIEKYGIVPQNEYPNMTGSMIDHSGIAAKLKGYLDSVLQKVPISPEWENNYVKMLDGWFGKPPEFFTYNGKDYTPKTFATEVVKLTTDDFVGLTSFTHHPFYKPFNLEVPDNYSGGLFYNMPIDELISAAEYAVMNEYTVGWDADVSNAFFNMKKGFAMNPADKKDLKGEINPDDEEVSYTQDSRQLLFENLTTQDDHLMHIVGLKKSPGGKTFFFVKNSWGVMGPLDGFLNVSETYFGINTITLVLPKNALSPELKAKLNL